MFEDDSRMSQSEVQFQLFPLDKTTLKDLKLNLISFLAQKTKDYIWNYSPVTIVEQEDFIFGSLEFGDLYDEEWLLMQFLIEFSRCNRIACRIFDADGEFVLIEAANELPTWLNPDAARFRVWMVKGLFCIIPQTHRITNILDAVTVLKSTTIQSSPQVHTKILNKAKSMNVKKMIHATNVYLPRKATYILEQEPQLISAVVAAFYSRDPIDLRGCRTMSDFPKTSVKPAHLIINKCHMAQLLYQSYKPDKRSGYLPLPQKNDPIYNAVDIGTKIATGFQILLKSGQSGQTGNEPLSSGKEFKAFLTKLEENGFFENELQNSARWTVLYQKAITFFNHNQEENDANNDSYRVHAARIIARLSEKFEKHPQMGAECNFLSLPPEDDLNWLNMDETAFNRVLNDRYKWSDNQPTDVFKNQTDELEAMTTTMKGFVKTTSDFEGIEVESTPDFDKVELDPTKFNNAIKKLLGENQESANCDYLDSDDLDSDDVSNDETEDETNDETDEYYNAMNEQLMDTKVFDGMIKEEEKDDALDVDLNLVAGLMKSYESQMGLSGPAGNLLGSLGIHLPENED